jgi:hypothetical protein
MRLADRPDPERAINPDRAFPRNESNGRRDSGIRHVTDRSQSTQDKGEHNGRTGEPTPDAKNAPPSIHSGADPSDTDRD